MSAPAVLFDLDGTLLDTLDDIASCLNSALAAEGLSPHPTSAVRAFVGSGVETLVMKALPESLHDQTRVRRLCQAFRRCYRERWTEQTRPYPGVPEALRQLGELGVPMAVLTNKPHEFATAMVARLLPDAGFGLVQGSDGLHPLKPDPALALELTRRLGIEPSRWVFVGDSGVDMQTATRAGMFPVGVTWGYRDLDELVAKGARHILHAIDELMPFVQSGPMALPSQPTP